MKLHLSPYQACGSGGLANSLGGANCVQNTGSAFAVPRPSPSFPSVGVHSPASRHLQYAYCKQREAGQGPGKKTSSAWCERLPEQQDLSFSSVVFYKSTALLLYGQYQVNIGIPKNRHPGCPISRKNRHPDAYIHVNIGIRMPVFTVNVGIPL